jgi:uncharacterized membrane protein/DNA-directed RNA polymerase subunit RPC12/RpoP
VWHEGLPQWTAYGRLAGGPPAAAQPAGPVARPGMGMCAECGRHFRLDEMVQYERSNICAECKPKFFQRVQEGAEGVVLGGRGDTSNADLMARARGALSGNWGTAIGLCVVQGILLIAISLVGSIMSAAVPLIGNLVGNILQLLLAPPFVLGGVMFFIALNRGEPDFSLLFRGFSRYWPAVGANFLSSLIISLCVLLVMLPGIGILIYGVVTKNMPVSILGGVVAGVPGMFVAFLVTFTLAMTFYVLADNPSAGVITALKHSQLMMRGMKWKLFCLNFRFIGWTLLAMLSLFIGFLWLVPYIATATAAFYDDVKGRVSMP